LTAAAQQTATTRKADGFGESLSSSAASSTRTPKKPTAKKRKTQHAGGKPRAAADANKLKPTGGKPKASTDLIVDV